MHHRFQQKKRIILNTLFVLSSSILFSIPFMIKEAAQAHVPPGGSLCMILRTTLLTTGCEPVTSAIDPDITKTPANFELVGVNNSTTVTIAFTVGGTTGVPITNVIWRERLANNFTFANPADIRLNGNSLPGNPNPSGSNSADISLGNLLPGSYALTFRVTFNPSAPEGTYPIENSGSSCSDPNSRFEYLNGLGEAKCDGLPAGSIIRRFPKLIFNSDAWIGNKSLQVSNTIKVGPNTLIISGQGTNSGISNYNLPTTGKLAWDSFESLMRQRVNRAIQTKSTQGQFPGGQIVPTSKCPRGDVATIYLDTSGDSPFEPRTRTNQPKTWILNNCSFTLRNATYYGTGTIINIMPNLSGGNRFNGGALNIFQRLEPANPTDTFGYISFRNGTSGSAGQVNLQGDADVDNMTIFTSGVIEMGGNSTGGPITREMQLVSRFLRFPPQNQMQHDIIFDRPTRLYQNVPPFFQQFTQPSGQEVP